MRKHTRTTLVRVSNSVFGTITGCHTAGVANSVRSTRIWFAWVRLFNAASDCVRALDESGQTSTFRKAIVQHCALGVRAAGRGIARVSREGARYRWWITFVTRQTETFYPAVHHPAACVHTTAVSLTLFTIWNYYKQTKIHQKS